MAAPGDKAALVTLTDNLLAAQSGLEPNYTIDVVLSKSRGGVLGGCIAIFKRRLPIKDLKTMELKEPPKANTELLYRDPEYFYENKGRWVSYAAARALEVFDELGTDAHIVIKAPRLKIKQKVSRKSILAGRADVEKLFHVLWDIDKLLRQDFNWDPWHRTARRGRIGADMAKR